MPTVAIERRLITAAQIGRLIHAAFPPRPKTLDTFQLGDAEAAVTGVVMSFQATAEVLRRAAKLGANLIISHEPIFYQDSGSDVLAGDPVYDAKLQFARDHELIVWRCHDAMHIPGRDLVLAGMVEKLGWAKYQDAITPEIFNLPTQSLDELAAAAKARLGAAAFRVTGAADLVVRRVALSCGCRGWNDHRRMLQHDGVDALLCGEVREWETCEYVRDTAHTDRPQGLIVLGHCNSEEASMATLADWLRPQLPEIPVYFVPAGDPFWYA